MKRRKIFAVLLSAVLAITLLPVMPPQKTRAVSLSNPRITEDSSMGAGQKVTYDCVWFGSYPQAEVINTTMNAGYTAIGSEYRQADDLIVSDAVYAALQNATEWDSNGDIILSGAKYRRIRKTDATYAVSESSGYYNWADSTTYHYFKYEPLKWRVLSTDGSKALIVSDKALDDQEYNKGDTSTTWATSTIRCWLNAYGASANNQNVDYGSRNFINSAFGSEEKGAIAYTTVVNSNNSSYGTEGGENTYDRIFLLSESEVSSTQEAAGHGFNGRFDEARQTKSSTYAKAMGTWWRLSENNAGNCRWMLRSPGSNVASAMHVDYDGEVMRNGYSVSNKYRGVRPALYLNLSSSSAYSYAGTVTTDGTMSQTSRPNITFSTPGPSANTGAVTQTSNPVVSPSPRPATMGAFSIYVNYTSEGLTETVSTETNPVNIEGDGTYSASFTANMASADIYRLNLDTLLKESSLAVSLKITPTILNVAETTYTLGACDTTTNSSGNYRISIRDKSNSRLANQALGTKAVPVAAKDVVTIMFTVQGTGSQAVAPTPTPTPAPQKVTKENLNISSVSTKNVKSKSTGICKPAVSISWTANGYASGYEIYRSEKKTKGFKKIAQVNAAAGADNQKYKDKKVERAKTYYYKVCAWYQDGTGTEMVQGKHSGKSKITVSKSLVRPKVGYSRNGNKITINFLYAEGTRYQTQYRYKGQKSWQPLSGLSGKLRAKIKNKEIRSSRTFQLRFCTTAKAGKKTVKSKWSNAVTIK